MQNDSGSLRVGRSKHSAGGEVLFRRYATGTIAIQVMGPEGPEYTATVALPGHEDPGRYGVWLKGWSENEGVPEALAAAGVLTLTGKTTRSHHAIAQHGELSERARQLIDRLK